MQISFMTKGLDAFADYIMAFVGRRQEANTRINEKKQRAKEIYKRHLSLAAPIGDRSGDKAFNRSSNRTLRDSFNILTTQGLHQFDIIATNSAPYEEIVRLGRRSTQTIYAKNKAVMKFWWEDKNSMIYARSVVLPLTEPKRYDIKAQKGAMREFKEELTEFGRYIIFG